MMHIKKIKTPDVDVLLPMRLALLKEIGAPQNIDDATLTAKMKDYFIDHIEAGSCVALVGYIDGNPACCGMVQFQHCPPNFRVPNGNKATIYGIYTHPDYRTNGYGVQLVNALVKVAKSRHVDCVDLMATDKGKPLYHKLGFTQMKETPMTLANDKA